MTAREKAIKRWARNYPLVEFMLRRDIPVTRENYIRVAFMGLEIPDPWTPELECGLPEFLQAS
ncbi:MAG: hypothetical protein WB760_28760 [Xanthobacteraceae bacterium]